MKKAIKITKVLFLSLFALVLLILAAHAIGYFINNRTPQGGINESMYIDINGDMDYQVNYKLAQDYYDDVNATYKAIYIMKNTSHGLMESKSKEFSDLLHKAHDEMYNGK